MLPPARKDTEKSHCGHMYDVHTIVSEAIDTKKNPKLKEVFSNAGVGIDNDRQEL